MTIKLILNLILFTFVINTHGQELDSEYLELKKSLLNFQVDLLVEYKSYCYGDFFIGIDNVDDCVSREPYFLLWIKEDRYYKRKFSNCAVFKTIEMEKSDFLKMADSNLKEIKKAELLPVMHRLGKNSKGEEETVQWDIDHFCESKFIFHKGTQKLEKRVNHYLLETKMIDENTTNDNYELNQKSIFSTLIKLIGQETAE